MDDVKKRGRGRPRKRHREENVKPEVVKKAEELGPGGMPIKRKRGRPRKNPRPPSPSDPTEAAEDTADVPACVQASSSPTEPAAKKPCDHPHQPVPVSEEASKDTTSAPSIPNLTLEESEDWVIISTPVH